MSTDPLKPGIKTSEAWVTILTALLATVSAVAAAMGWAFDGSHLAPLIPVAATVIAGLIAHGYVSGRASVKVAAIAAASNTGGHVVAAGGTGADPVVGAAPVPVADPAPAPAVAADVPPPAPEAPASPPSAVGEVWAPVEPVADDVPPLIGG